MSSSESGSDVEEKPVPVQKKAKLAKKEKGAKKAKKEKPVKRKIEETEENDGTSSPDEGVADPTVKMAKSDAGTNMVDIDDRKGIELGKMKYASIISFRGTFFVDIREFYTNKGTGGLMPSKKGITLSYEQFSNLKKCMNQLDTMYQEASGTSYK